jgi:hypothetical protein
VPAPICEAADFVQRETGRAFLEFPDVELADDEAFQQRLLDAVAEDLPELEGFGRTLRAVGLLEPQVDLIDAVSELFAVGVVGFYEPTEDVLVVRGTDFTPYTRIVIVHELVHALDDQWFDIDRSHYDDATGEIAFGFSALVEGHASVIDDRYRSARPQGEQAEAVQEELQLVIGSGVDLTALSPVLIELLGAPYLLGAPLVERILDEGGTDALAEAFADPPTTSEQVLHPDRYLAREPAIEVPAPAAEGEVVDDDVMGEYGVGLWLGDAAAAEGWGGDRYVTWRDGAGDGWCTRMDLVMDTEEDLAEVRSAFERWAGDGPRRTVDDATVGDSPAVRVTGCA